MKDPKDELAEMREEEKLDDLCPKCPEDDKGNLTEDDDPSGMTDGQYSEWFAGHGHVFRCNICDYQEERNVDMFEGIPEEEELFEFNDEINAQAIEDLIDRAIEKKCFIEALSLIHNVIEFYLKYRIRLDIFKREGLDELGFDSSRYKKDEESVDLSGVETDNEKRAKEKFKLCYSSIKKVHDCKNICFILNLINKDLFDLITKFNKQRNTAIHSLLKKDESKEGDVKYRFIRLTAKLGREIQLKLSPLDHSDQDIMNILKKFDVSDEEAKKDRFLKQSLN